MCSCIVIAVVMGERAGKLCMNEYIKDIREKTAGMSRSEKLGYIVTYYWYHILGIAALVLFVVIFVGHFLFGEKPPLFSCVMVNMVTDDARDDRLAEGFAECLGLPENRVLVDSNYHFSYEGVSLQGVNESYYDKFFLKWSNSELDAVIMEEDLYQYCKKMNGTFRDLDEYDTGNLVLYEDEEDGMHTAVVLDSQELIRPLRQAGSSRLLLVFPRQGRHEEKCQEFIDYIVENYKEWEAKGMNIQADHPKLQYSGRIDFSDPKAPVFVFPCTYVRMRFTGSVLKAYVKNNKAYWDNYMGCILDGKQMSYRLPDKGEAVFEILLKEDAGQEDVEPGYGEDAGHGDIEPGYGEDTGQEDMEPGHGEDTGQEDIEPGHGEDAGQEDIESGHGEDAGQEEVHEVLLFKRQDACHELTFCGFEIAEGARLLELEELPERRIEVYGDSVSAGELSEAVAYEGKEDPPHEGEYSNSWYSYAWMTARKLQAQIHDIAQGGIALMDETGWFCGPQYIGMESVWDKVHYNPQLGKETVWDFSAYIPHVVIVAIGQNDSNPQDYMKEDPASEKADQWRAHYRAFLEKIRATYPDAYIVCCTTLLNHDKAWDDSIEQVCSSMQDPKVTHYMFRRNGNGTPGHLRISEAEEMAEELSAYINGLGIKEWE